MHLLGVCIWIAVVQAEQITTQKVGIRICVLKGCCTGRVRSRHHSGAKICGTSRAPGMRGDLLTDGLDGFKLWVAQSQTESRD